MSIEYDPNVRNGALDEFITPPQLIRACLSVLGPSDVNFSVLDAGCNLGQWGSELRIIWPNAIITGVEKMIVPRNPNYNAWIVDQDYLTWNPDVQFDMGIGNPPYSLTVNGRRHVVVNEWIKHSLDLLRNGGGMFLLLRKGFNHSVRAWRQVLNDNPPYKEYMLLPRPNFYGSHDVRTDGSSGAKWDYSFVWFIKGFKGNMTSVPLFWKNHEI